MRSPSKNTRTVFGTLLATFAICTVSIAVEKPEKVPVSGKIHWVYDYEEGKALSLASGKPMFVVFRCER